MVDVRKRRGSTSVPPKSTFFFSKPLTGSPPNPI
jgi:hypothetical protein